jgi:hypothetical protein
MGQITQNQRICVVTSSNDMMYGKSIPWNANGGTMAAVAEVMATAAPKADRRGSELPTCPVCADSMVAAEASAYLSDGLISYLWTCDTCGYGFVTKHTLRRLVCN